MIALLIISMAGNVQGQGRGHNKGHERYEEKRGHHQPRGGKHDHDRHRDKHAHHWYERHDHHPAVHHRQGRYHDHGPVAVRNYHARPRYVYYRDYDVYYDTHREVYISYAGRNWSVSASVPVALRRVDVHRAVRMEVDYDRDDFHIYLEKNRPTYRRIYTAY